MRPGARLTVENKETEISPLLALVAAALLMLLMLLMWDSLSLLWFKRML